MANFQIVFCSCVLVLIGPSLVSRVYPFFSTKTIHENKILSFTQINDVNIICITGSQNYKNKKCRSGILSLDFVNSSYSASFFLTALK